MTVSAYAALETDLASGRLAEVIADIAEEAARLILPYWRADTAVETKADASPVTEADRAAEALILSRLAEHWPQVEAVGQVAFVEINRHAETRQSFRPQHRRTARYR